MDCIQFSMLPWFQKEIKKNANNKYKLEVKRPNDCMHATKANKTITHCCIMLQVRECQIPSTYGHL